MISISPSGTGHRVETLMLLCGSSIDNWSDKGQSGVLSIQVDGWS